MHVWRVDAEAEVTSSGSIMTSSLNIVTGDVDKRGDNEDIDHSSVPPPSCLL